MKTLKILLAILVALSFPACNDDDDGEPYFPEEIAFVISDLSASFDSLNTDMAASVTTLSQDISDTTPKKSSLRSTSCTGP